MREIGNWPWSPNYEGVPLTPDLYGSAIVLLDTPEVQLAPTVSEMIARSRVPTEYWYRPIETPKPPRPTVPEEVAKTLATRTVNARAAGHSRQRLASLMEIAPGAVWRIEQGRVTPDEVNVVSQVLDDLLSVPRTPPETDREVT